MFGVVADVISMSLRSWCWRESVGGNILGMREGVLVDLGKWISEEVHQSLTKYWR